MVFYMYLHIGIFSILSGVVTPTESIHTIKAPASQKVANGLRNVTRLNGLLTYIHKKN